MSCTWITGCVLSAAPAGPPAGWVVKKSFVAGPGALGENPLLMPGVGETPLTVIEAVSVYVVDSEPAKVQF